MPDAPDVPETPAPEAIPGPEAPASIGMQVMTSGPDGEMTYRILPDAEIPNEVLLDLLQRGHPGAYSEAGRRAQQAAWDADTEATRTPFAQVFGEDDSQLALFTGGYAAANTTEDAAQ